MCEDLAFIYIEVDAYVYMSGKTKPDFFWNKVNSDLI